MHKLKRPQSKQVALGVSRASVVSEHDDSRQQHTRYDRASNSPGGGSTQAEQYWKTRALTAEALLRAKDHHAIELRELRLAEEHSRQVRSRAYLF